MEKKIIKLIEEKGPLTGAELLAGINDDPLLILRSCRLSKELTIRIVGTRYLRFDRKIEGYARLSPSILREFLTYSIIGLSSDPEPLDGRADTLLSHIEEISRAKSELAFNLVSSISNSIGNDTLIKEQTCFILAGDIVFNMAHDVPRPERSTGKLVKGSDMDIVVIVDDRFPDKLMKRLDEEIFREKCSLLLNPYIKEEIDYIVKKLARVREQVKFDNFKYMVACKILLEGTFLYGSDNIFHTVKTLLREHGVIKKISDLEARARAFRDKAEEYLTREALHKIKKESLHLFYPTEESEEFE
ncbi:hypothetical protein OAC89_06270 [Deltaproteobacteria bacterium]|nr:hypothetical protein [Deltaproteobacteria bacterium]